MTTIPAALSADHARHPVPRRARLCVVAIAAVALAGCETGGSLFGGSSQSSTPAEQTNLASAPLPTAPSAKASTRIAIAPIIGAPETVGRQLQQDFSSAVGRQNVVVAAPGDTQVDYTLRGYIVAAKEKTATKVSYIWDVTDPSGKRVNRITGEELVSGATGKDPWTSVSAALTQSIAEKSATSFGAWLPGQSATAGTVGGVQTASATSSLPIAQPAVARSSGPTTASIVASRDPVMALVPSVVGAPGDGSASLTSAIQRELSRNGVSLAAQQQSTTAYRVEGRVIVGRADQGKQPIQIDWQVRDPAGKSLGTVSQKNEIPEGSLDGAWGQTADAAAAAAAQGIIKLLPNGQRATN